MHMYIESLQRVVDLLKFKAKCISACECQNISYLSGDPNWREKYKGERCEPTPAPPPENCIPYSSGGPSEYAVPLPVCYPTSCMLPHFLYATCMLPHFLYATPPPVCYPTSCMLAHFLYATCMLPHFLYATPPPVCYPTSCMLAHFLYAIPLPVC